jgi:hypothetical protein
LGVAATAVVAVADIISRRLITRSHSAATRN